MEASIEMNPNVIVRYLGKPASAFTRADIIRYCKENCVEFINFHYCGWDGKLCCAARHGFEMPDSLKVAERTFVGLGVNIHEASNKAIQEALEQLPGCCVEAASELDKDREIYTGRGVFSDNIVDYYIKYLKSFDDTKLRSSLDEAGMLKYVEENINNG